MDHFDDLIKLIAAEGLYQLMKAQAWQQRLLLSRAMFVQSQHKVTLSIDGILVLFKSGLSVTMLGLSLESTDPAGARPGPNGGQNRGF